jgi:hypothetical protein
MLRSMSPMPLPIALLPLKAIPIQPLPEIWLKALDRIRGRRQEQERRGTLS